jgi:hypothetical protein
MANVTNVPMPLPHRSRALIIASLLILVLFFGLSWAAVAEMTGYCKIRPDCLAVDRTPGNCLQVKPGSDLLTGTVSRKCELSVWGVHVDLSDRTEAIVRKLGVRFFYM